jgi:membrane protease YdiL (CAAX protease family)
LAAGVAGGFLALSLLIALLFAAGAAEMQTRDLRGAVPIAAWGGYWLVFFIFVGFFEEMLTRGYPLFAVSQGIGFWPAAVLFAVVFGLGHLGNSGEDYAGIANAMLAGLVFAFSLKWTGSLWWAIGAHMAWDWGQTFFFGVADSGIAARHHLLSVAPVGVTWLSGGRTGPEGSVLCIPVLLLLGAAARLTAPPLDCPDLERRRAPAAAPAEIPEPTSPPSVSPSTYSVDSGDTN